MKELERLLIDIIDKGWNPWGIDWDTIVYLELDIKKMNIHIRYTVIDEQGEEASLLVVKSIRELVSLESWLWSFLCDNKLIKQNSNQRVLNPIHWPEWADCEWSIQSNEMQFRLIQSSLIPENELVEFLIKNIILQWKQLS